MTFPTFLILGAAKAGTTALYYYLRQHPQVGMSRIKETNFFALMGRPLDFRGPGDDDYINRFSVTTWEGYCSQFPEDGKARAIGESSPLYLYSPDAPRRIAEALPAAKLVVLLRDPVDRAFSAFLHLVRDGRETATEFREALRREPSRIADHWEHIWQYRAMGLYHEQLSRYFETFGREQIRVYLYEELAAGPVDVLQDLFRFLEVDEAFSPDVS